MGGSRAARGHLSIIKGHYEIAGYMFEGEAKNAIKNKRKYNRVKGGLTRPHKHSDM